MPPRKQPPILKKLATAVKNDPQKAGILVVLVSILVVLQVRLQMNEKGGPAKAKAATSPAASAGTGAAHNPHATNQVGHSTAGANPASGSSNAKPQDASSALRAWMDSSPKPIGRNLFAVDLERFPHKGGRAETNNEKVPTFWDELAKSMTHRADVRKERQIRIENLAQQASQLRLQSTVMGASPKAVVNGELVGEGDVVAAGSGETRVVFRVLKIEARRIVIEREGIKLEIPMK